MGFEELVKRLGGEYSVILNDDKTYHVKLTTSNGMIYEYNFDYIKMIHQIIDKATKASLPDQFFMSEQAYDNLLKSLDMYKKV